MRSIVIGFVIVPAVVLFMGACSPSPKTVALPSVINTVAAGYPFALQIKDHMAQDADLTTVLVDLDRQSDRFHARRLTYGFASSKGKTRVFAIAVDNTMHQAFGAMDSPDNPNNSQMPASALQPLDLSRVAKEITEVLEVAKTNGLAEFCLLTPPKSGNVDLGLRNSGTGPVWYVTGDGWDDKGPIAEIHISIDARTGAVLSLSLEKAVGRP